MDLCISPLKPKYLKLLTDYKKILENKNNLLQYRDTARKIAEDLWDWDSRIDLVSDAFTNSQVKEVDSEQLKNRIRIQSQKEMKLLFKNILPFTPKCIQQIVFRSR